MFIIKSGGVNKVLIDNKPSADRLNLTEVEGIIKNRAKLPFKGFANLAREGNTFYILSNNKIYKGNPRKNWTEIADITDLFANGSIVNTEVTTEGLKLLMYFVSEKKLYLYKIADGVTTLLKKYDVEPSYSTTPSFFILNNIVYQSGYESGYKRFNKVYKDEGNGLTDITSQIVTDNIRLLTDDERDTQIKRIILGDKLYIIRLNSTETEIYVFDGLSIVLKKKINSPNAKVMYPCQEKQVKAKEFYTILSTDYNSYYNYQTHYLLDENFDIVDTISTIYNFNENSYFCIKENNNYEYITREHKYDKDYNLVEFPVKAYVRRE